MLKKIKNIILKTDLFLYKKFGSDKSIKPLQNIKEAKIIFSHLNDIGEDPKVRFVGGCVRKAICGEKVDDIDLATSLHPDEVKKKLQKENIKVLDTGILHGTVTAILNKKKFEITSLRKDISTDGRHAIIEHTSDWELDASRRDFTINAIYADIEGRIFDPLGGRSDLYNGKIKFIGLAEERIQEDFLRILRYFRFFIQYSKIDHEESVIRLIKKHINGLNKISNERIFDELKKILSLKNLYNLFSNESSKVTFLNIFPQLKFYERLKHLKNINKKLKNKYDYKIILALLIVDETDAYEYFCYKFKTSNSIKKMLKNISLYYGSLTSKKFYTEPNIKKLIYFSDNSNARNILLFSKCINSRLNNDDFEKLINFTEIYKIPKFPISGDDLKKYGYVKGEELGNILKSLEKKWIENNFTLDKNFLKNL